MRDPNYPAGVTARDIDRIGEPVGGDLGGDGEAEESE